MVTGWLPRQSSYRRHKGKDEFNVEDGIFWFPPEDKDLVGHLTGRDPLGFLALWSQRGRDIVRNLTEQTRSVAGFQMLFSTFRLYEEFQQQHPDTIISPDDFFILVEQAFAYSNYHCTKSWPLLGISRVSKFYDEGDCRLSLYRQILSNQLGNGCWGLYRGAAFRSNMVDNTLRRLSDNLYEQAKDVPVLSSRGRKKLFSYIVSALENHEKGVEFRPDNRNNLFRELSEIINTLPDKKLLKQYIVPDNSPEERIAKLLYKNRKAFGNIPEFRRIFIKLAMETLPDMREDFENICRCEDFIAPVESLFYYLFNFKGMSVGDAAAKTKINLNKFSEAFGRFCDSGKYKKGAGNRFKIYRDGIDRSSIEKFITSLLDCHLKVATGRGREPWLVIEGGKIVPFIEFDPPNELNAVPGKTWRNDYYLKPLLSIYSGLRR